MTIVGIPGGGTAEFPDDMPHAEIEKHLASHFGDNSEMGPLEAGIQNAKSDLQTAYGAVASTVAPEYGKEQYEAAEKRRAEVNRRYHPQVPSYTDIKDVPTLGRYIYEQGASSLPQMAATMGAGAIAAAAAPEAIPALGAAMVGSTVAGLPFFTGQNIKEQTDNGTPFEQTKLAPAIGGAVLQSGLDSVVDRILPGMGKAAKGSLIVRAAKKGLEGSAIEGTTEGLQQAIQIAQADPSKLWEFSPEVQKSIMENAVAGGILGGAIGGVSGAVERHKPSVVPPPGAPPAAAATPTEDNLIPPRGPYDAPAPYAIPGPTPNNMPGTENPAQAPAPYAVPTTGPNEPGPFKNMGPSPLNPPTNSAPPAAPPVAPTEGPAPGSPAAIGLPPMPPEGPPGPVNPGAKRDGQRVYEDVQQKLLAAGEPAMRANAAAKLYRARYETLGSQLNMTPWEAYKQTGVGITQGKAVLDTKNMHRQGQPSTLLQEDPTPIAKHYSALEQAINKVPMKQGTPQQWLNALQKQGAKPEELEWTGLADHLNQQPNKPIPKDDVKAAFLAYPIATYEKTPHTTNKPDALEGSYAKYTLGEYGNDPQSKYREVVLGEDFPIGKEGRRGDEYQSSHWNGIDNPLAHYRTTERTTSQGDKALMLEEAQSDWHQAGAKKGYSQPGEVEAAQEIFNKASDALEASLYDGQRPPGDYGSRANNLRRVVHLALTDDKGIMSPGLKKMAMDYHNAQRARDAAQVAVPDAPFKQSWPSLTFRHALMDAINGGHDMITWPTGQQQLERYGMQGDESHGMAKFYDKRLVDVANKLGKPFGAKVEKVTIGKDSGMIRFFSVDKQEMVNGTREEANKQLRDIKYDRRHAENALENVEYRLREDDKSDPAYSDSLENDRQRYIDEVADFDSSIRYIQDQLDGKTSQSAHEVHAMRITPSMRELISHGGLPLFQTKKSMLGALVRARGYLTFSNARLKGMVITLTRLRNASTFIHESGHLFLQEMRHLAKVNPEIAQDLKTVLDWFGIDDASKISNENHERFARGFEQYMRTGKAPSPGLAGVFKQFSDWLKGVYQAATELKVKVPPEIAKVYDRLLTREDRAIVESPQSSLQEDKQALVDQAQTVAQNSKSPNIVKRAQGWMDSVFDWNPFSNVSGADEYRKLRNSLAGNIHAANESATKAQKLFAKSSLAEKNAINEFLETPAANPLTIPAAVRSETVALKNYINGPLKKALVDNNLLSEEASHAHDDSYLPRLYLKHLLENKGIKGSGTRLNRSYSQRRELNSPEAKVAYGEVKDPGVRAFYGLFRPQRDLAVMDFLEKVGANKDWVIPRSTTDWNGHRVTPQWLKAEAQAILEDRIPAEPDPARKAAMKVVADQMIVKASAAATALKGTDYDHKLYTALPDTADFGPLRGMIVNKQIADDIKGTANFVQADNFFDKFFGDRHSALTRGVSLWKFMKVPLNPPSQIRNIVSNMILINLSGVPIHRVVPQMIRAAKEMSSKGALYKEAVKRGLTHGTMTEQELFAVNDAIKSLEANNQKGLLGWRNMARATAKIGQKFGHLHGLAEQWGKMAVFMDAVEKKGLSHDDAMVHANKWLFDYSEVHPGVRRLRQSPLGMPFATFQYKMVPLMNEVITKHPTRLLPYIAMAYTIPALVAAANNIGQDDAEKLRKSLSTNLRRKNDMYLLPWKDSAGRWQFVDIGYFMPWQAPGDVLRSGAKAAYNTATGNTREGVEDLKDAASATGLLQSPVTSVITALTTGIDPFTSRAIADKRDPPAKQVADIMGYVWNLAVPSLAAGYGAAGQAIDRAQGSGTNRYGEPATTTGQIAARAVGVNTTPIDPQGQRARNIQTMQYEIQQEKGRMTSSLRDQSLTPERRRRIVENFTADIRDRYKQLQEYVRDTQPSARLLAASRTS